MKEQRTRKGSKDQLPEIPFEWVLDIHEIKRISDSMDVLNSYPKMSIQNIIKKINKYEIISFDIFDTLIKRDVSRPDFVFELVEREFNRTHDDKVSDFRIKRIQAERKAREEHRDREVTLEEIYAELVEENFSEITCEELKNIELKIEAQVCVCNIPLKKIYDYSLKKSKKVYIISDMYLPRDFVERLLVQCGYSQWDGLFLSSDIGKTKRSGALFDYVIDHEKLSVSKWLHTGDGVKTDYLNARAKKINTCKIARDVRRTRYVSPFENNITEDYKSLLCFINNHLNRKAPYSEQIGYEVYGPVVFYFVKWLDEHLDYDKTTLFFARDCYVIMKALELYRGELDKSRNHYFIGSRRSVTVPALYKDSSLVSVQRLLQSSARKLTLKEVLTKIGVESDACSGEMNRHGLTPDTILDREHLVDNAGFAEFYHEIEPAVRKNAEEEYSAFLEYFNSLNCTKNIQVVDIGWRCSMQKSLEALLADEGYKFKGYYFGVRENSLVTDKSTAVGYYLNREDDFKKKCFLAEATALIEIFFSAPQGSAIKYRIGDEPLLRTDIGSGEDAEAEGKFVEELQAGALQFVIDYRKSIISKSINVSAEEAIIGLVRMGENPLPEDLDNFSEFYNDTGANKIKTAAPKSIGYYLSNPKDFKYDFAASNWKIGYMKRMIKAPINYHKLFEYIYKHKG